MLERVPDGGSREPRALRGARAATLVDGERSVLEICRESEIGDNETLKVLYALLASGPACG